MTQEHENRLEWAVEVLRETPALPENFLGDFEQKLAAEPEVAPVTNLVVTLHPTKGGVNSKQTARWARGLVAALLMLCALIGLVGRPKTQVVAVKPTGLFVVASAPEAKINEQAVTSVLELDTESLLETGDESLVLMAGEPGHEIKIGPQSRVGFEVLDQGDEKGHRSELQLASGSVFITESKSKVSVRTAHALIAPVGTDYRVVKSRSSTEITVLDGIVNVQPPQGGRGVSLRAGQRMTVDENADWKRIQVKALPESGLAPLQATRKRLRRLKSRPEIGTSLKAYPKAKAPRRLKPLGQKRPLQTQVGTRPKLRTASGTRVAPPRAQRRRLKPDAIQATNRRPAQARPRVKARPRRGSTGNVKYPVRVRGNQARKPSAQSSGQRRARSQASSNQGPMRTKRRPGNSGPRGPYIRSNPRRNTPTQIRQKGRVHQRTSVNRRTRDSVRPSVRRRGGRR